MPTPKKTGLKRVSVAISYTTHEGHGSKSSASTASILSFGRITDPTEATKQAIMSGLRELYTLASLEGFPEEASIMMDEVLGGLREKGLAP